MHLLNVVFMFCLIPVVDITRVIGWIKTAAADVIKWAALRLLLISIVTVLVPLAIYKGWLLISEKLYAFVMSKSGLEMWGGAFVEITGLGGWLGSCLNLVECFQIVSTFLALRFSFQLLGR